LTISLKCLIISALMLHIHGLLEKIEVVPSDSKQILII